MIIDDNCMFGMIIFQSASIGIQQHQPKCLGKQDDLAKHFVLTKCCSPGFSGFQDFKKSGSFSVFFFLRS